MSFHCTVGMVARRSCGHCGGHFWCIPVPYNLGSVWQALLQKGLPSLILPLMLKGTAIQMPWASFAHAFFQINLHWKCACGEEKLWSKMIWEPDCAAYWKPLVLPGRNHVTFYFCVGGCYRWEWGWRRMLAPGEFFMKNLHFPPPLSTPTIMGKSMDVGGWTLVQCWLWDFSCYNV